MQRSEEWWSIVGKAGFGSPGGSVVHGEPHVDLGMEGPRPEAKHGDEGQRQSTIHTHSRASVELC